MAGAGRLTSLAASLLDRMRGSFPSGPVIVALSGGADSAVCAWAASQLCDEARAVTVDHGLEASAALVAAAAECADHLGLAHTVVDGRTGDTSEAGLRTARYRALEAAALPGEVLATGHTADDQAETTLGNLLRGAGAAGLAGIPESRGPWRRPLLGVARSETRAAAAELGLPFGDDPDNEDPAVRRSRIRTEVIPYLEGLNPSVRSALIRAGRLAAADEAALEQRSRSVAVIHRHEEVRLAAAALTALPDAVASRAVRRGLRLMLDPYPGGLADVEEVLAVASGAVPSSSISTGLLATREGPWVTIHRPGGLEAPDSLPLEVPGRIAFGRWWLAAERTDHAPPRPLSRWAAVLRDEGGLMVRAAAPGDVIDMGEGSKQVTDALREAGAPARLRPVWPVVEQAGRMVWVPGARLAAGASAEPGSPAVVLRAGESV